MKTIILDTNFIVSALKNKIDIFREIERIIEENYEIKIIDKTINELEKLKDKLAIKIVNNLEKIKSTEDVDTEIVKNSDKNTIVATLDRELKQRLKNKGAKTITIRQKTHFKLES
jgi:rRNA-processing protein FCF1